MSPGRFLQIGCAALLLVAGAVFAAEPEDTEPEGEDVTAMAAYNVTADRIEDFGFRVRGTVRLFGTTFPSVAAVYPNTAAARAGLRPGDRILRTDGKSAAMSLFSLSKWRTLRERKLAEVNSGKSVTWTLELEDAETKQVRAVTMTVPTPPPHWGAKKWVAPAGRAPALGVEPGPLAERSRTLLDHGIWALLAPLTASRFGLKGDRTRPVLGYEWSVVAGKTTHRCFVTQQNGRTEIVLEAAAKGERSSYLTSPAGELRNACWVGLSLKMGNVPLEQARAGFERELAFWLNKMGKVSERWPLELVPEAATTEAGLAAAATAPARVGALDPAVARLPLATDEQRALFAEALGKVGADADQWAYTETVRMLDDKRVYTVRFDPAKPDAERCTLLQIDGKPPKPADVQRWRDEGRDVSAPLGQLPAIATLVDPRDLRVHREDAATLVFELPLQEGGQFGGANFQALVRVNKAWRGFEDMTVKLRASVSMVAGVKLTDAGFSVRFQSLTPHSAPQPVALKLGGGGRILLVPFARSFEATRTQFSRVVTLPEPLSLLK